MYQYPFQKKQIKWNGIHEIIKIRPKETNYVTSLWFNNTLITDLIANFSRTILLPLQKTEQKIIVSISKYSYYLKNPCLKNLKLFMDVNCLKVIKPLWEDNLLFTIKFPEFPGTHLINLRKMKDWVDSETTQWF